MLKTKKEVLESFFTETLIMIVNAEIEINVCKRKKPEEVVRKNKEIVFGRQQMVNYTAKMVIEDESAKLRDYMERLEEIKKMWENSK